PRDPAEVRRYANGTAPIAGEPAGRTEGRDGRRLAAARSAGRTLQTPGVIGAAGDEIVGLVSGQQFGCVGSPQDDGPLAAKPRHRRGVTGGRLRTAQTAAHARCLTRDIEAVFDSQRDPVQQPEGFTEFESAL